MEENRKLTALEQLDSLAAAVATEITTVKASIPKDTSDLTNNAGYQTEQDVSDAISAQIGRVYKPSGTVAFASLPTELTTTVLGNVYNVSDKFTTDDRFVEGAGSEIPAGTNVAVVQIGETFKFDVLAGAVDLSNYVQKETNKGLSTNDYTTEEKEKLGGIAANATKVEKSEKDGCIKINGVDTTVVAIATDDEVAQVIAKYFPQTA